MTAGPWPDRRSPKSPAVGQTVEIAGARYVVTGLHQTDDGMLLAVRDGRGPARFVLAHELAVGPDGVWRAETEAELREAWGK